MGSAFSDTVLQNTFGSQKPLRKTNTVSSDASKYCLQIQDDVGVMADKMYLSFLLPNISWPQQGTQETPRKGTNAAQILVSEAHRKLTGPMFFQASFNELGHQKFTQGKVFVLNGNKTNSRSIGT